MCPAQKMKKEKNCELSHHNNDSNTHATFHFGGSSTARFCNSQWGQIISDPELKKNNKYLSVAYQINESSLGHNKTEPTELPALSKGMMCSCISPIHIY
jgi:hypothetical protein